MGINQQQRLQITNEQGFFGSFVDVDAGFCLFCFCFYFYIFKCSIALLRCCFFW